MSVYLFCRTVGSRNRHDIICSIISKQHREKRTKNLRPANRNYLKCCQLWLRLSSGIYGRKVDCLPQVFPQSPLKTQNGSRRRTLCFLTAKMSLDAPPSVTIFKKKIKPCSSASCAYATTSSYTVFTIKTRLTGVRFYCLSLYR